MNKTSQAVNFEKWQKKLGLLGEATLSDIFKIYSPFAHKVRGFFDASPSKKNGYNRNQQAVASAVSTDVLSRPNKGGWLHITGPMDSGKSASLVLSATYLKGKRPMKFLCHVFDKSRTKGIPRITTHGNGEGLKAEQYSAIKEIVGLVKKAEPGTVILGDELHFAKGVSLSSLSALSKHIKERQVFLVSAGLDMTFTREAWPYTKPIIEVVDRVLVLTARCQAEKENCKRPALYSQRLVDGEPARRTDPIILVGKTQHYHAACPVHHKIKD